MQDFPHRYAVSATAAMRGEVAVGGDSLPRLFSAPPAEFGGPGDRWSPETLLVAAVADCYVLTFRAIAQVAQLHWHSLRCDVTGTLDRVERVPQFTQFAIRAELEVPEGTDRERAQALLEKAERACLVTNSLKGESVLCGIVRTAEKKLATAAAGRP